MLVAILKVMLKMISTGSDVKRCGTPFPLAGLLSSAPLCSSLNKPLSKKQRKYAFKKMSYDLHKL
jgi:hypothetical protein